MAPQNAHRATVSHDPNDKWRQTAVRAGWSNLLWPQNIFTKCGKI